MVCAPILSYAPSQLFKTLCKHFPPASQVTPGSVHGRRHVGFLVTRNHTSRRSNEEQQLGTGLLKLCPGKDRNPALAGEVYS